MKLSTLVKPKLRREGDQRGWPDYLFWGRIRTSTVGLIVAFLATWWLYETYQPPAPPPAVPTQDGGAPFMVPNPDYTWVPRTRIEEAPPTTTTPTTTTTTPTTTTPTTTETSPTDTTSPDSPADGAEPAIVDPDGPGPLPPTTVTTTSPTVPGLPFPLPTLATPTPLAPPR